MVSREEYIYQLQWSADGVAPTSATSSARGAREVGLQGSHDLEVHDRTLQTRVSAWVLVTSRKWSGIILLAHSRRISGVSQEGRKCPFVL
jgi:hypothetical protein